jgi:hypothetical protein
MLHSIYLNAARASTIILFLLIVTMLPSVHVYAQPKNSNKIPKSLAIEWRKDWKSFINQLTSNDNKRKNCVIDSLKALQGFFIPIEDLKQFIKEAESSKVPAIGIRLYLAIGKNDSTQNKEFKLLMVGVLETGVDMIAPNSREQDFIFDLTSPCPNTCDSGSPLYISNSSSKVQKQ